MARGPELIRASEIGEYVYCSRAWWMRRVLGYQPTGQARRDHGVMLHARHGRAVAASNMLVWLGIGLVVVTIVVGVLITQ